MSREQSDRVYFPCTGQRRSSVPHLKNDVAIRRSDRPPSWRLRDKNGRLRTFSSIAVAESVCRRLELERSKMDGDS